MLISISPWGAADIKLDIRRADQDYPAATFTFIVGIPAKSSYYLVGSENSSTAANYLSYIS
jgi:hypothetical protein